MLTSTVSNRKNEIHLAIAAGNLKKAFKRSLDFITDFSSQRGLLKKVISLKDEYNVLLEQHKTGPKIEEMQRQRDQIVLRLLDIIDQASSE